MTEEKEILPDFSQIMPFKVKSSEQIKRSHKKGETKAFSLCSHWFLTHLTFSQEKRKKKK